MHSTNIYNILHILEADLQSIITGVSETLECRILVLISSTEKSIMLECCARACACVVCVCLCERDCDGGRESG